MKIGIIGGTGFLGSHLARRLTEREEEHRLVLVSRGLRQGPPDLLACSRVTRVSCGVSSPALLAEALQGCDTVIHAAGINREKGEQTFRAVHVEGTRNVLAACRQNRVERLVLVSYLRARPGTGSPYHQTKWEAEELVRQSGLDYTIIKPGILYGPGDQFLTRLQAIIKKVPFFGQVGWTAGTLSPLAVSDLCDVLCAALESPGLKNQTFSVVGPEELTTQQVVDRVAHSLEMKAMVVPLPVMLHHLAALVMEQFMDQPLITRAQVVMLSEGASQASPACCELPEELRPQTRFEP